MNKFLFLQTITQVKKVIHITYNRTISHRSEAVSSGLLILVAKSFMTGEYNFGDTNVKYHLELWTARNFLKFLIRWLKTTLSNTPSKFAKSFKSSVTPKTRKCCSDFRGPKKKFVKEVEWCYIIISRLEGEEHPNAKLTR